ncbi:MAG: ribbon-helix-helix protein, CopG family [Anaerolineales bacterium]|nr:ribbon-helix-helix protein, CopG family [Anaerolineales bacterium]
MIRTQIQITDHQAVELKEIANDEGVSVAELIRRSIDQYLRLRVNLDAETRRRRAQSVIGKYASSQSDVSYDHDRYLTQIYAEVNK